MTHYLLDTNHASVFRRKREQVAGKLQTLTEASLALCLPSIGELWHMVFRSARIESNTAELELFLSDYDHWPYDGAAARNSDGSNPSSAPPGVRSPTSAARSRRSPGRTAWYCSPPTRTSSRSAGCI